MTDQTKPEPLLNARDDPEWWKERDRRRKARYATDPEYSDLQRERSRAAYRAKTGVELFDPRLNLDKMEKFGKVREVEMPHGTTRRWVMTKAEVAEVFGKSLKLFYAWVQDNRFPEAVLFAIEYPITRDYAKAKGVKVPQRMRVYTSDEVIAAIKALGEHLSKVSYYRADHERERTALFEAVRGVRRDLGLPEDAAPEETQ